MYRIYTWVLRLGLIVISPYQLARSRKYWPTLRDRLGFLRLPRLRQTIWIHAVSVGEMRAVEGLVEKIRAEYPERSIVVSTTTPTGQALARARRDVIDHCFYFPLDIPGAVRRALDRISPELVIIAETEIWPNFLRICSRRNIPVLMINGRISDKSLPRYMKVRRWLGPVLDRYRVLGMQSETDRSRIESLGADRRKVTVFGNLKYDVQPSHRPVENGLARFLGQWRELWIAASTMPGEDERILDTFLRLRSTQPGLKLLIAPRHPDRSDSILTLARERRLQACRRSALAADCDLMVLDTIGELAAIFQFATVVFMGGSLVERGGHNVLEPASFSKPIVFGPHMQNFRDIARRFTESGGAVQVADSAGLQNALARILSDPALAQKLGQRAHQLLLENSGATERVLACIRMQIVQRESVLAGGER